MGELGLRAERDGHHHHHDGALHGGLPSPGGGHAGPLGMGAMEGVFLACAIGQRFSREGSFFGARFHLSADVYLRVTIAAPAFFKTRPVDDMDVLIEFKKMWWLAFQRSVQHMEQMLLMPFSY